MSTKKITQERAEEIIESYGFTLISEYINSKSYVDIYCPTCEENFNTLWAYFTGKNKNRDSGGKCPNCNKIKNRARTLTPFDKVKEDFESMGYILLAEPDEYVNKDSRLRCICPCGRETTQKRQCVLNGNRCNQCGIDARADLCRTTLEEAIIIANKSNLTLLEYSQTLLERSKVKCNECNLTFMVPLRSVDRQGTGCPKCNTSKGNRKLRDIVELYPQLNYMPEFKFEHDPNNNSSGCRYKKDLRFDMWIEPYNGYEMLIEIDGIQHFQEVGMFGGEDAFNTQREKDVIKSLYCYNNNIPLLRIHYDDLQNLKEHVDMFIKKYRFNKPKNVLMYSNPAKYEDLIKAINTANK